MKLGTLEINLRSSPTRIIALALLAASIALLLFAYASQTGIDQIGVTNDPILQKRLNNLTDQRDASMITALGCLFLFFFTIFVVSEKSISMIVSEDQMIGTAKNLNEIIAGLALSGNSMYLPAKRGLTKERLFIPAANSNVIPPNALSDDLYLSPGKDGSSPGILTDPLGLSLLNTIEKELGTSTIGAGIESTESSLQMLRFGFGMMKDFHFKERDGKVVLRVEYSNLLSACRSIRKEKPDTCRQISCIGCSCLLTGLARATGKAVAIENVDNANDRVVFTLNLQEW